MKAIFFGTLIIGTFYSIIISASELFSIDQQERSPVSWRPLNDLEKSRLAATVPQLHKLIDTIIPKIKAYSPFQKQDVEKELTKLEFMKKSLSELDQNQKPLLLSTPEGQYKILYWLTQCLYLQGFLENGSKKSF